MPTRTIYGITDPANNWLTLTLPSETGFLTAVSAYEPYFARGSAELFGIIGLGTVESATPLPHLILASHYFGAQHLLGWTGHIRLHPSSVIIARFRSLVSTGITLTINTED